MKERARGAREKGGWAARDRRVRDRLERLREGLRQLGKKRGGTRENGSHKGRLVTLRRPTTPILSSPPFACSLESAMAGLRKWMCGRVTCQSHWKGGSTVFRLSRTALFFRIGRVYWQSTRKIQTDILVAAEKYDGYHAHTQTPKTPHYPGTACRDLEKVDLLPVRNNHSLTLLTFSDHSPGHSGLGDKR
jgi:hypothetical protein